MNSNIARFIRTSICMAGLLWLGGCDGANDEVPVRAAVRGTVSLDGNLLSTGIIRFVPVEDTGGPKTSMTIADGIFAADEEFGPVVGKHRIEIESLDDGGYAMDDEAALQQLEAAGNIKIELVSIPAVYNSRSALTETVTVDGPNEFRFDLKSNPRQ